MELIGKSPAMKKVVELIEMVAPTEATVLITGESALARKWWRAPFTQPARGATCRWSPSIAARLPKRCSKASCSVMKRLVYGGAVSQEGQVRSGRRRHGVSG